MTDTDLGSVNDDDGINPAVPQPGTVIDVNAASKHASKYVAPEDNSAVTDEQNETKENNSVGEPVADQPPVVPINVDDSDASDENSIAEEPTNAENSEAEEETAFEETPDNEASTEIVETEMEQTSEIKSSETGHSPIEDTQESSEQIPIDEEENTNETEDTQDAEPIIEDDQQVLEDDFSQDTQSQADSEEEIIEESAEVAEELEADDQTEPETAPVEQEVSPPQAVPAIRSELNTRMDLSPPKIPRRNNATAQSVPNGTPKNPAKSVAETDAAIAAANSTQPLKGKKSKKKWVMLIVVLLILAALAAAAFVFQDELIKQYNAYFNKEEETTEPVIDTTEDEVPVEDETVDEDSDELVTADDDLIENVNKIHTELELYYVDNAIYPASLLEIEDVLPEGIVDSEEYIYMPTPLECVDDCSGYSLYATLSDDTIFERNSINE